MFKKLAIISTVLVFMVVPGIVCKSEVKTITPPTILKITGQASPSLAKPQIAGVVEKGYEVNVYIDGIFAGVAKINASKGTTDDFYFNSEKVLADGNHVAMVVAKDKTSQTLSAPSKEFNFVVLPIFAPTLIQPANNSFTANTKPLITGLTPNDTRVNIYIDGAYTGVTQILAHKSGTANFAFSSYANLKIGSHKITATAEDVYGRKSAMSQETTFTIEYRFPAPTIYKPVINKRTTQSKPFIVGLAKNDSKIKVFIDKKFAGEFQVTNHQSGTANFAFKPATDLIRGVHSVYTTATDYKGKESIKSKTISFLVKNPSIVSTPVSEIKSEPKQETTKVDVKTEPKISETTPAKEKSLAMIDKDGKVKTDKKEASKDVKKDEKKSESKKDYTKQINLAIFIIFVIGVIVWIIWVNRELIKEKKDKLMAGKQNNKSGKEKNKK
jgi:hypothetical protein